MSKVRLMDCPFSAHDCFAFSKGACKIMKCDAVLNGSCPFYKTEEAAMRSDLHRVRRIKSLGLTPREEAGEWPTESK